MRKTIAMNITLFQGADFAPIILVPSVGTTPLNITGYSFYGCVKETTDPNEEPIAVFTFTILNQTTNEGEVLWYMSKETIDQIIASIANGGSYCRLQTPYLFDVFMTDTLDQTDLIITGKAMIYPKTPKVVA